MYLETIINISIVDIDFFRDCLVAGAIFKNFTGRRGFDC